MKLAAAAVGMDAARISREWEQQINSRETAKGESRSFGIRFSQALATTTESALTTRSLVGSVGSPPATPLLADDGDQVLSRLAEEVVGQPVRLREPRLSLGQGEGPLAARGVTLSTATSYHHEESLFFSAQGSLRTVDGRDIAFELNLSLRSRTTMSSAMTIDAGLLLDPLILQFDTTSPLLGDSYFTFDLDGDGGREQLACPGWGCGFLAFDRNGDGVINDGRELFGPESGRGFAELVQLDSDANLWIDENDPIFSSLSIWRPHPDGGSELQSLAEAGVGAIAVTHAGTSFQLRDGGGKVLGEIAATSVFLTEAGEVRAVHEVELAQGLGTGANGAGSGEPGVLSVELTRAIETLRHIVRMQRLRLRFLVIGRQARERQEQLDNHRDPLFSWLQEGRTGDNAGESTMRPNGAAAVRGANGRFYSQKT